MHRAAGAVLGRVAHAHHRFGRPDLTPGPVLVRSTRCRIARPTPNFPVWHGSCGSTVRVSAEAAAGGADLGGADLGRQDTVIASSFARRYAWESTGSCTTRPTGAGSDSTRVCASHS